MFRCNGLPGKSFVCKSVRRNQRTGKSDQYYSEGEAPVFSGEGAPSDEPSAATAEGESVGRQIYKHLMNGVSHMLPFVIGGGILIALAFLFDMGNAGTANFGSGTPLAAFLKNIGGLSFSMMMPILAGYIAMSIGERPALMPGVVGGFLAVNGGSGFFGALFAGFIAGYLVNWLKSVVRPASGLGRNQAGAAVSGAGIAADGNYYDVHHQPAYGYVQQMAGGCTGRYVFFQQSDSGIYPGRHDVY